MEPSTFSLFTQLENRVATLYRQAERYFGRCFHRPTIQLNLKGEAAGQAWPARALLRFNPILYAENQPHFLQQAVAHEVAHLIAYAYYGCRIKPHGKEWQAIMTQIFNVPADRCHHYDTRQSARRPYHYRCQCHDKTTALSPIRHARAQRGIVYLCTACNSPLFYAASQSL